MNKHIFHGLIVDGLFAVMITWVAAFDAIAEGGLALLASAVFGPGRWALHRWVDRGELCHAGGRGKRKSGRRSHTGSPTLTPTANNIRIRDLKAKRRTQNITSPRQIVVGAQRAAPRRYAYERSLSPLDSCVESFPFQYLAKQRI